MPSLLLPLVLSAVFGALIGMIRQWRDQAQEPVHGDLGGMRTYAFWAMIGCVGAFAAEKTSPATLVAIFALVGAHQIVARVSGPIESRPGSTTFASSLITLLLGCLVYWEEYMPALLLAATTMVLVGNKPRLHAWTRGFTADDMRGALQFVAISGIILPLAPNRDYGPYGAFNPYSIWLTVVLISGLGFAGYIALRVYRSRAGIALMSLFGGLASSTASTLAFSRRSKLHPACSEDYALAVAIACTVMLPRVLVPVAIINRQLAIDLIWPMTWMAVPGILYSLWVWLRNRPGCAEGDVPELGNPLSLSIALKFAALYAVVTFLVKAVHAQGWVQGIMPLSFLTGLFDVDAIALSIAHNESTAQLAVRAVTLGAIANTLLKAGIAATLGSPALRRRTLVVLGATALAGAGAMFYTPDFGFGR